MGARRLIDLDEDGLRALVADEVRKALSEAAQSDDTFSHDETAAKLGISSDALRKRIARGHIVPDIRAGMDGARSNRFARSTIAAYVRRHGNQQAK